MKPLCIRFRSTFRAIASARTATLALVAILSVLASSTQLTAGSHITPRDVSGIERCLVRSAIVPVDPAQAGDEAPTAIRVEYAYRSLQYELLLASPDDVAAIALTRGENSFVTGLSVVRSASAPSLHELVEPALLRLPESQREVIDPMAIADAGSTPVSARELCNAMDTIVAGVSEDSNTTYVAIEPDSAGLLVGSEGAIDVHVLEAARSVGDRVRYFTDSRMEPAHRSNDINGVSGGIGIMVGGIPCSAGFAASTSSGSRYLISAGHCPTNDGNGAAVSNGTDAGWCPGASAYTPLGTVSSNLLNTQNLDVMAVMNSSATGSMWMGSACIGSGERSVAFATSSSAGSNVGFSGVRSGQQTGVVTSSPAGCYFFPFKACAVYQATSNAVARLCQPGDSGGPAFGYYTSTSVAAAGIISAHGGQEINRCSYTDIATILYIYDGTLLSVKVGS